MSIAGGGQSAPAEFCVDSIRFDRTNSSPTNSVLNRHVSLSLPPSALNLSAVAVSPYLSIFSTLIPLNCLPSPVVWMLVDAISAYALVETWRARSGASKGKKDMLIAVSYVSGLTTWLFFPALMIIR